MTIDLAVTIDASGAASGGGAQAVPWWSFTKTIIAIACFRAAEAGQLDLHAAALPGGRSILAVLRHEAGLPDYGGWPDYHAAVAAGAAPWPTSDVICRGLQAPKANGWVYSNIGYAIVARRLTEQLARPLGEILHSLVFAPAGVVGARLATRPEDVAGMTGVTPGYDPNWVYHGLVVGPLVDTARVAWRLASGDLLGPDALREMQRPTLLPQFSTPGRPEAAYGAGVMLPGAQRALGMIGHSGSGPGSDLAVYARRARSGATSAAAAFSDDGWDVEQHVFERMTGTQNG